MYSPSVLDHAAQREDTATLEVAPSQAPAPIKLSADLVARLRCPVCHSGLSQHGAQLLCQNAACGKGYPIVSGVPILLNEQASIFSIADVAAETATYQADKPKKLRSRYLPQISKNFTAKENTALFVERLLAVSDAPKVLLVGGRKLGQGMEALRHPKIELVGSDISAGPMTQAILDAHDVPFADQTFDGIVAQAVLEHVADPYRCVEEMYRVLKPNGYVYAETPFMQQVHGGDYGDFTRFTHYGHRRLFRKFSEVSSGVACGPGMALAWSLQYYLMSFPTSKRGKSAMRALSRLAFFPLTQTDRFLNKRPGALAAASGYFFIGQRGERALSDRELMGLYGGVRA